MKKTDVIYARQSIDKADSISIESQIEYCKHEVKSKEFKVYYDKGYSGKNTDRPQFQKLLDAVRRGETDRVICYKLDRISRSILDFATMMEEFEKHGVKFVSCTEKFDTSTPMGWAMLNICIVFAQLERETIQQRVTDAYTSRSRKGYYMGGRVPYGYRLTPYIIDGKKTSKYEANPEEAEIIRLIYSLYCESDYSCGDITRYLNSHELINSRSKNKYWNRSRISEIIKNPVYVKADKNVYNFFKQQNSQLHNCPEEFVGVNGLYMYNEKNISQRCTCLEGKHIVLAPHEGLIPSDLWIKARTKCLNSKQFAQPIKGKNSWLVGKAKCGKCGYAMVIKKSSNGSMHFICSQKLQTFKCSGVGNIKADVLEYEVINQIEKHLTVFGSETKRQIKKSAHLKLSAEISKIDEELNSLAAELSTSSNALLQYINMKINALVSKKQALINKLKNTENAKLSDSENPEQLKNLVLGWKAISFEDRKRVVDKLITVVNVFENAGAIIDWKI